MNATEHEGKWKALSTDYIHGTGFIETIYKHQVKFGQLYRSSLKGKTEALGYETELTGGPHGLWEVKGFTEPYWKSSLHATEKFMAAWGKMPA